MVTLWHIWRRTNETSEIHIWMGGQGGLFLLVDKKWVSNVNYYYSLAY